MVCTLLAGVNVVAFAADGDDVQGTPVYCAYNQNNGEHFFTTDKAEYDHLVALTWGAEGEKWQAPAEATKSPIYRLYNQNSGEHYFTLDANEAKGLASIGWNDEGIGLYSDDNMGTPVYCMYNPNATGQFEAGAHHYTKDAEEAAYLESIGWTWTNDGQAAFYGVKEEEPQILVKVTDADQLTANTIEITFDQDATGLVSKDDIVVAKADGTLVLPVLKMELGADGTTATLTLSTSLKDETDYEIMLNESEVAFTASVGAPAYVVVSTDKAQKGVVTDIEFSLYDSKGVDVTSTVDVDDTCTVEVEGDAQSDTSTASKSTITMDEVGAEATVTVSYNDGEGEMEDIVGKNTVTCIPAEAVVGYPVYTEISDKDSDMYVSDRNDMAKFYLGKIQSDPVTVVVGEESDGVYFSAVNLSDMSVYDYEEYEITSSDEDIMSIASTGLDEGKKCSFTVAGNKTGTANVVVTAKVNDTETPYTIPVRVVNKGTLNSVTFTVDRSRLTNAADKDYYAVSSAYAVDTNGLVMTGVDGTDRASWTYEVTSGDTDANDNDNNNDAIAVNGEASGFHKDETQATNALGGTDAGYDYVKYTAYQSNGGKKVIKATASVGDKDKSKSVTINVEKLGAAIWNNGTTASQEQEVTYTAELTRATVLSDASALLDEAKNGTQARLGAYVGSKFVGYVRTDKTGAMVIGTPDTKSGLAMGGSAVGANGTYNASTDSAVKVKLNNAIKKGTLAFGLKYGSKYTTNSIYSKDADAYVGDYNAAFGVVKRGAFAYKLGTATNKAKDGTVLSDGKVGNANNGASYLGKSTIYVINPEGMAGGFDYVDDADLLTDFTPSGKYEATFAWISAKDDETVVTKAATLTVGTILQTVAGAEKITVKSRTVDSLDTDGVKDAVVAIADMNNASGDESAIQGFAIVDKNALQILGTKGYDWGDDSQYVKYAIVQEQVAVTNVAGKDVPVKVNFYVPLNTNFKQK